MKLSLFRILLPALALMMALFSLPATAAQPDQVIGYAPYVLAADDLAPTVDTAEKYAAAVLHDAADRLPSASMRPCAEPTSCSIFANDLHPNISNLSPSGGAAPVIAYSPGIDSHYRGDRQRL